MKFQANNTDYTSPNGNGVYPQAYVEDTRKIIDGTKYLSVDFVLKYIINGKVVESNHVGNVSFNELSRPMTVFDDTDLDEKDNPKEVLLTDYLAGGGVYDKSKVADWGHSSAEDVQVYFDQSSVWDGLAFKDHPFKQISINWLEQKLVIDSFPMVENFSYAE